MKTEIKRKKTPSKIIRLVSDEKRLNISDKKPIIEIRNMDIVFGKKQTEIHAVKNLSLNVYKGEVLGIVGESGSGKSTTGNAILGLVNRKNGTLKIKDRLIPADTKKIKGNIKEFLVKTTQMIFQDPASSLNPHKTIKKIISEGLENIDPKQVFGKTFDGVTAKKLSELLDGKKQPKVLEKVSLEWVTTEIENDRFEKVTRILYIDAIKILYKMNEKYTIYAANYLRMRKNVRDNFLKETKNKNKIIDKLILDIIESVGLNQPMLKRYPLEFSGGQQQRIGISRAVVLKPEILVADEPISALDVSIQAQVVNIFNELKNKLNLTIVFIAHDLRMVEYISDRIVVMYKGQILETGEASEILAHPIHPYTKSLIHSVPTLNKVHASLRSKSYDPSQHQYDSKNQAAWFSIDDKVNHFVYGTKKEIIKWRGGKSE